jgi:3-methyladenine DNA glycosylase Tag
MRDPERIQRIIEKLSTIWAMDKDCRFGQLVYAIFWQMPQTKIVDEQVNEGNTYITNTVSTRSISKTMISRHFSIG